MGKIKRYDIVSCSNSERQWEDLREDESGVFVRYDDYEKLEHENKLFRKFLTCAKSLTINDMAELAHILDMECAVKFDKLKENKDE